MSAAADRAGVATRFDLVREDEAEAARREVTSVPTFLVDEVFVIPGAQAPGSMLATLRRIWTTRHGPG